MSLMREVGNGGFDQFYRNSSKRFCFLCAECSTTRRPEGCRQIARRGERALGKLRVGPWGRASERHSKSLDEKMSDLMHDATCVEGSDVAFYALTGLPESLSLTSVSILDGILRQS